MTSLFALTLWTIMPVMMFVAVPVRTIGRKRGEVERGERSWISW
jgi:hypothetical protein